MEKKLSDEINKKTLEKINQIVKKNWRVLDAGVGNGEILNKVKSTKKYGVDVSFKYLCNIPSTIQKACANLENLPYKSKLFDLVICSDVLEHVFDLNKVIGELQRVLKDEGYLIVRVPYQENLKPYLTDKSYQFVHVRNFNKSSCVLLFSKIFNFKIESLEETGKTFQITRFRQCIKKLQKNEGRLERIINKNHRTCLNELLFLLRSVFEVLRRLYQTTLPEYLLSLTKIYERRNQYLLEKLCNLLHEEYKINHLPYNEYFSLFKGSELIIVLKK